MSFVHLSGLPSPGADSNRVECAGRHGGARPLKTRTGGAAQRIRQKATRERRRSEDGARRTIERTCVGCGKSGSAEDLLRVVLHVAAPASVEAPGDEKSLAPATVLVDLGGKLPGRGAWIHPQPGCITRACARGFSRAFAQAVVVTPQQVIDQLRAAAERRLGGLLLASARSRHLVYGRDAVKEVLGNDPLVILATDAQAVAKDGDLQRAGLAGKVMWWSTKAQLGHWLGRSEVGVVAITEPSIAEVMKKTIALASLSVGTRSAPGSLAEPAEAASSDPAESDAQSSASVVDCSAGFGSGAAFGSSAERDEELSEVR